MNIWDNSFSLGRSGILSVFHQDGIPGDLTTQTSCLLAACVTSLRHSQKKGSKIQTFVLL